MSKYDEQFKLEAVQRYLSGLQGYREVAQAYGIDRSMLRRWVASYQQHGAQGLRGQYTRRTTEFKLEVLARIERDKLSDRQAMAIYNLRNAGVLGRWRSQYAVGLLDTPPSRPPHRTPMPHTHPPELAPKDMTEQQLREEVAYLRAELDYLKKLDALIQAERTEALVKKRKWSKD